MDTIDFSLVLACYNEGPTLKWSLDNIKKVLEGTKYSWEVICINDTSKDDTLENLQKFAEDNPKFKILNHEQNVGRGGTVAEGIKISKGRVVGFIDVDLEVSAVYIPEFIRAIDEGFDVAIASRVYKEEFSTIPRWIGSRVYVMMVRKLLKLNFKDTEAGYKFFNKKKILPVLDKVKDKKWFFDTEIVTRSFWAGLKIKEITVLFLRRPEKQSTVHLFSDSWEYLLRIMEFKKEVKG